ncbi:hypothetical protein HELRODRAFT_165458 [Helobdella robusta]|uniref:Endonuclease/exonuclease/phosphatase domain-containing protein n=1 Tax=Helobdella robusta TaxID=6412 RepID=T1EWU1_HELRO|nr:hypothetical protein HELRODRAFT_165458 [Helobdella robusta]ESN91423.1 hypothetical protein HELRODRAFT_165458 [Helobdella robusta]
MYKPGSAPITVLFYDDLVSILEYLTILNSDILLKGDFNLHVERTSDPRSIRKSCQRSYTYPRRYIGFSYDDSIIEADIFISPPADGINSDEDDVLDEIYDQGSFGDLPARQLLSNAEVTIKQIGVSKKIGINVKSCESEIFISQNLKKIKKSRQWKKFDMCKKSSNFKNYPTPIQAFLEEDLPPHMLFFQ